MAHAGEEGGPETVTAALDILRVERVDHGIRAMEDPALVTRLREHCGLTPGQLETLAVNSFDASFIDDSRRQAWKQDVRAFLASQQAAREAADRCH